MKRRRKPEYPEKLPHMTAQFVCVSALAKCISRTDLLRQVYVLPH